MNRDERCAEDVSGVGGFLSGPVCLSMRSLAKIQVIKRFFVNFMCVSDQEGERERVEGGGLVWVCGHAGCAPIRYHTKR